MNKTTSIVIAIIVLVLIGGGVFLTQSKNKQATITPTDTMQNMQQTTASETPTPSMDSTSSGSQNATDSSMTTGEKTFIVEGGAFFFKPNEIRVKKGDKVKIVFSNSGGMHDFVIDEFNVKTTVIGTGKSETVEFTADKAGTFEYYCSVGNHRAMGMKGNLIVE